jgi:hypothetical protein
MLRVVYWLGTASGRGLLVDEQHDDGRDLEGQGPLSEAERRHEEDQLPILMTKRQSEQQRGCAAERLTADMMEDVSS